MGSRLTNSASPSSTTVYRTTAADSSTNSSGTHTNSNSTNYYYSRQHTRHNRYGSDNRPRYSHGLFSNNSTNHNRPRITSTNMNPLDAAAFNMELLRYVGLEHESDEESSDDDSPHVRRNLYHYFISLHDIHCPVCNKTIPNDLFEKHILQCLSKPRIDYNEDTLIEDKGECVICLDDLLVGQRIARLPCLCIYHKSCIDSWFRVNRSCPEHPGD